MSQYLEPVTGLPPKITALLIISMLIASAISIGVSPSLIPESYSWLTHSISESAAQGLTWAWVTRSGFLLFGFAVLWLTLSYRSYWGRTAYYFHLMFGLFMVATAAYSHKPWLISEPYDVIEDLLHSITSTGMGFAFALGVLSRLLQRQHNQHENKALDIMAILASFLLPILSIQLTAYGGLLQRAMFVIAYIWYGNEALKLSQTIKINYPGK
jgi:sulfite exporter TauE/SafE